jgi:hemerythrin
MKMPFMNWSADLSVNIKEIDEQHKKLINLLNDLHDAMKAGKGKILLGSIFTELVKYTDTHFKFEEEYFTKYNYAQTKEHSDEHDSLRKTALELKAKFDSGNIVITVEVLNFLVGWIENHIMKIDKRYTQFLNSKGVF